MAMLNNQMVYEVGYIQLICPWYPHCLSGIFPLLWLVTSPKKNAPTAPALRRVADQVNWARSSKGGGAVAAAILIGWCDDSCNYG